MAGGNSCLNCSFITKTAATGASPHTPFYPPFPFTTNILIIPMWCLKVFDSTLFFFTQRNLLIPFTRHLKKWIVKYNLQFCNLCLLCCICDIWIPDVLVCLRMGFLNRMPGDKKDRLCPWLLLPVHKLQRMKIRIFSVMQQRSQNTPCFKFLVI